MRQLALRIAERSFASFEELLGWIAVSCVVDSVSAKGGGGWWELRLSIHESRVRFSPDGKWCSSGAVPPSPWHSWGK
jgi:hypothetical protein